MLKEYFTNKKAELLEEKAKIEAVDYSEKIAIEVEEFKAQKAKEIEDFEIAVKEKYAATKKCDVSKIDCYLEFVESELAKIEIQEAQSQEIVEETEI